MLTKSDLNNLRDLVKVTVEETIDEKFGTNILERIDNIEKNVDKIAKAVSDDRDELDIVKGRVSNLDVSVSKLESVAIN